VPPNPPPQ